MPVCKIIKCLSCLNVHNCQLVIIYKKFRLEQLLVKYGTRNVCNILQLYTELDTMLLAYGTYLPTDL